MSALEIFENEWLFAWIAQHLWLPADLATLSAMCRLTRRTATFASGNVLEELIWRRTVDELGLSRVESDDPSVDFGLAEATCREVFKTYLSEALPFAVEPTQQGRPSSCCRLVLPDHDEYRCEPGRWCYHRNPRVYRFYTECNGVAPDESFLWWVVLLEEDRLPARLRAALTTEELVTSTDPDAPNSASRASLGDRQPRKSAEAAFRRDMKRVFLSLINIARCNRSRTEPLAELSEAESDVTLEQLLDREFVLQLMDLAPADDDSSRESVSDNNCLRYWQTYRDQSRVYKQPCRIACQRCGSLDLLLNFSVYVGSSERDFHQVILHCTNCGIYDIPLDGYY